jgi:hypothetical protein
MVAHKLKKDEINKMLEHFILTNNNIQNNNYKIIEVYNEEVIKIENIKGCVFKVKNNFINNLKFDRFIVYNDLFDSEENLEFKIGFDSNCVQIKIKIYNFLSFITNKVNLILIVNDNLTNLFKYEKQFRDKNIVIVKITLEDKIYLENFIENNNLLSLNIFKNYDDIECLTYSLNIKMLHFYNFDKKSECYLSIESKTMEFNSIVISTPHLENSKNLRNILDRVIKLFLLFKNDNYKIITITSIIEIISDVISKLEFVSPYLYSLLNNILLHYKIRLNLVIKNCQIVEFPFKM